MTTPRRLTPLPPPPPRTDPRPPQPQAPPPSESDGNSALMASAAADSNADNSGSDVDVSGAPDDAANALYGKAADGEKDGGGILQTAAADDSSNDAVSEMMDSENSTHSSLEAFDAQATEEATDLQTGEQPDDRPLGIALRQLVQRVRMHSDDKSEPPPEQPEEPQGDPGDPDADGDFDDDGTPNHLDPDYEPPPAPEDTPAPTRGPVDLSNIPPSQPSQQLADIGQESPVNPQEMIDPRFRSSAAKNDLSLPTGESPYRRRGGRGKAARHGPDGCGSMVIEHRPQAPGRVNEPFRPVYVSGHVCAIVRTLSLITGLTSKFFLRGVGHDRGNVSAAQVLAEGIGGSYGGQSCKFIGAHHLARRQESFSWCSETMGVASASRHAFTGWLTRLAQS